jgi:hypothetical protein
MAPAGESGPWTQASLGETPEVGEMPRFSVLREQLAHSPAPRVDLAVPRAEITDDRTVGGLRTLEVRVTSPRGAPCVSVWEESGARLVPTTVDGARIPSITRFSEQTDAYLAGMMFGEPRALWKVYFCGLDERGVRLGVRTSSPRLRLRMVDESHGFEVHGAERPPPRPPDLAPSWRSDIVYVSASADI